MDRVRGLALDRGRLLLVELDPTLGHEHRGTRPCVVVSDPAINSDQRYPVIAVVPVTGTPGEGALYPVISPAGNGLSKTSYALIDQLRSIDKTRIRRFYGSISKTELGQIDLGLRLFLGLLEEPVS